MVCNFLIMFDQFYPVPRVPPLHTKNPAPTAGQRGGADPSGGAEPSKGKLGPDPLAPVAAALAPPPGAERGDHGQPAPAFIIGTCLPWFWIGGTLVPHFDHKASRVGQQPQGDRGTLR